MGMITAQRIAAALLGGSMSGAQLETLLGTASGLAGWKLCAATQGLRDLLIADTAAKTAWMGSGKAVDAMAALSTDGAAVIAGDSTLMASVFNTAARADAWFASATTRAAIWASDTALTALAGSATGKARARSCAKYFMRGMNGIGDMQTLQAPMDKTGAKFILIGWGTNYGAILSISERRAGSVAGVPTGHAGSSAAAAIDNVMALQGPVRAAVPVGEYGYFGVVEV